MNENKVLEEIKDAMDIEQDITPNDKLDSFEEWDSLAMLTILSFFHDNDINIEVEDIEQCSSIEDIVKLAIK